MPGRRRCRRHGGAPKSGAPKGNRNRLLTGLRSRKAEAERRALNALLREARALLRRLEREDGERE